MVLQPNVPVVNAGVFYVSGLSTGSTGVDAFAQVGPGAARDSTNTNDIVLPNFTYVNGNKVGVNGVDVAVIAPSKIYFIYLIGDSTSNNPSGVILSLSSAPVLPAGYDMFRRIGYCGTDASAAPNTKVLKWYQLGAAQDRTYDYDAPAPLLSSGLATPIYSVVPSAPTIAFPSLNTDVVLLVTYTPTSPGNVVHFLPYGSPAAAANPTTAPGIVQISGPVASVPVVAIVQVPTIFAPSLGYSAFLYRAPISDTIKIDVVGFDFPLQT